MASQRNICFFTAGRSDYYLLRPLLNQVKEASDSNLQLIVGGMHTNPAYGNTWRDIKKDGFDVSSTIPSSYQGNSPEEVLSLMSESLIEYTKILPKLKPDLCVVLGDRYEVLGFAIACHILGIPLAHIHGGELSYGSFDDGNRHAISKLANLHFPSTKEYRDRVIQLGENPKDVFNVGALAVENILQTPSNELDYLSNFLGVNLGEKYFLVTFHPETVGDSNVSEQISHLSDALKNFPDYKVVWTISNADPKGKEINEWLRQNNDNFILKENLGEMYLPIMQKASAVIGNSSSGIIEAPIMKVPTVNIGKRQDGRSRTNSIIDCDFNSERIISAIRQALSTESSFEYSHPYGSGNTSKEICRLLQKADLDIQKEFYNIKVNNA